MLSLGSDLGSELFASTDDHGTRWAFLLTQHGDWFVTRDGTPFSTGSNNPASLAAGVKQFMTLTHPHPTRHTHALLSH